MNSSLVYALLQAEPTEANLSLVAKAISLAPPSDGRRALERHLVANQPQQPAEILSDAGFVREAPLADGTQVFSLPPSWL